MGFRFRRSIKIAKGVRLNLSGGRGLSLSIGGRGATVNLSSKGTRTTLGIPGTGISWTSSSRKAQPRARAPGGQPLRAPTPRGPSAAAVQRELAALQREMREQAALAAQQRDEDSTRSLVDWWRHRAAAPPDSLFYSEALSARPLPPEATLERPQPPRIAPLVEPRLDIEESKRSYLDKLNARHLLARPERDWGPLVSALVLGGFIAIVGIATSLPGMFVIGAGLAALTFVVVRAVRTRAANRAVRAAVSADFSTSWPHVEARLVEDHRLQIERVREDHACRAAEANDAYGRNLHEYESAQAAKQAEWEKSEAARILLLQQLIQGDAATSERVLSDVIATIDFPFEAEVDIAISDQGGEEVQLLVDLPEIEDAIPETKVRALKNGNTKPVKRTAAERFGLYAQLVVGLGVALGTQALCVLPAANVVIIAGYTQRRKRGQGTLEDQFVYEITIPRDASADLDPETDDPLELLQQFECRFDLDARGNLRKISPPAWAPALMGDRT